MFRPDRPEGSWFPLFSPHTRGCSAVGVRRTGGTIVFPAYAGMFRRCNALAKPNTGFPRIRGDVPKGAIGTQSTCSFSPHTRGCSGSDLLRISGGAVFPAYAGMFRPEKPSPNYPASFPRIRGDVPVSFDVYLITPEFSPHTRGCSASGSQVSCVQQVFPAYAGMFRSMMRTSAGNRGFPRIRGDVPLARSTGFLPARFSPHTRGCSARIRRQHIGERVFPAYAGMFRRQHSRWLDQEGFPRIRGDVPNLIGPPKCSLRFSPHTRGCSYFAWLAGCVGGVFPAYAGMFRLSLASGHRGSRFPRIRGDVPLE